MPRVLMMAQRYSPYIGGVERHIERISEILAKSNYQITILTPKINSNLPDSEIIGATEIIRFPNSLQKNPILLLRWFAANKEKMQDFQIVHCHDFVPILFWSTPFRIVFPRRPIYATYHGYERDPVPLYFKFIRKMTELLIRGSLCIGSFIRNIYGTKCNATPLGAVSRAEKRTNENQNLLYVGRLEPDTPILQYLEALTKIKNEDETELKITICGGGSLQRKIEEYCQENGISARLTGKIQDPTQYYLDADIALAGGFLSILEAMSYGLPVIAYSGTPLKQQYYKSVLTAGGKVSIQSTSAGVAREIQRLRRFPALYRSVSEQAVIFAENNNWVRLAETYVRLWTGSI